MIVVSDTSLISALFRIGELHLLPRLYGEIIVPFAVMGELLELEKSGVDIGLIKQATWLVSIKVKEQKQVDHLLQDLDVGEAEAIILAKELNADWLLIDESKGRKHAKIEGLHVIGLLGVFLLAKENGVITDVKPYVQKLISIANFRITNELFERILFLAKE